MSNITKAKNEAWIYYQTWMKERTYCPLIKQEILITRKGWDHLVRGRRKRRNFKDTYRRFKLLKTAKYIISKADKFFYETSNKVTYIILTRNYKKNRAKVILKKNKEGRYFFFSVMDNKK